MKEWTASIKLGNKLWWPVFQATDERNALKVFRQRYKEYRLYGGPFPNSNYVTNSSDHS